MGRDFVYEHHKSRFKIVASQQKAALKAVKALDKGRKVGYVYPGEMKECRTLAQVLGVWGWYVETDEETGDIGLSEAPEKYTDAEELLWEALAPFVESGSYLQCLGPEGEHWRWCFEDGEFYTEEATVTWGETGPWGRTGPCLNDAELATVLAALRMGQRDHAVLAEMDHFDEVDPLSEDEIDALCERLNTSNPDGFLSREDAEKARAQARERYEEPGSIEIDEGAPLSGPKPEPDGDLGVYVQAWVWVDFEAAGIEYKEDDDE